MNVYLYLCLCFFSKAKISSSSMYSDITLPSGENLFLFRLVMDKTFHIPKQPTAIIVTLSPKTINCHMCDSDFFSSSRPISKPDRFTPGSSTASIKGSGLMVGPGTGPSVVSVDSLFSSASRLGEEVGDGGGRSDMLTGSTVGVEERKEGAELGYMLGNRVGGGVGESEGEPEDEIVGS